jgi:hypothetical protein
MTEGPLEQIRKSVEDAKVIPLHKPAESDAPHTDDAPPADGHGKSGQDDGTNEYGLPEGCPVIPLGRNGRTFYYLTPLRQMIALGDKEHSQQSIPSLFSPKDFLLETYWPRRKVIKKKVGQDVVEEWTTVGWDVAACFRQLMKSCTNLGVWKTGERLRGPGGWTDYDGKLVYHCGNKLWSLDPKGKVVIREPGRYDGMVYAADAPLILPYDEPVPGPEGPAEELWDLFKTWTLSRRAIDSMLLLGHVGCSMVGGALPWRPMIFITAEAEAGKSTLQEIMREVHGPGGMITAEDATEAGISSLVGMSCLPVSIDEIEAEADNERAQAVIRLARLASSGGLRVRGSSSHEGHQSRVLSTFAFSAINAPSLAPQDRRRMGIIRLGALVKGSASFTVVPSYFHDMGAKLKRRIADHWHRFSHTQRLFREMLFRAGHSRGGLDQYGTMMAMAHIMLYDHDPDDGMMKAWEKDFNAAEFRETSDIRSSAESCLDELVQSQPDVFKGGTRKSVAQLVREIVDFKPTAAEKMGIETGNDPQEIRTLKDYLSATGLGIVTSRNGATYLAVPYAHKLVAQLYRDSAWKAVAGNTGGWVEALSRLPNVKIGTTAKIAGRPTRSLLVPVDLVLAEAKTEPQKTEKT